jgi:hypothetical protein
MEPTATPFDTTTHSTTITSGSVILNTPPSPVYTPTIAYGDQPNQFGQLRTPGLLPPDAMPAHDAFPIVVLIHGGFWRDSFDLELMAPLATDLSSRGYATWNLEYRGVGSSEGGWPETANDIAAGIDHLAEIADEHGLDLDKVIVIGHSAGGQLALWSAARDGIAIPPGEESPPLNIGHVSDRCANGHGRKARHPHSFAPEPTAAATHSSRKYLSGSTHERVEPRSSIPAGRWFDLSGFGGDM